MWDYMNVVNMKRIPPNAKVERNQKMKEMFMAGKTLEEVGKEFGLSRQRVFQIVGGYKKPKQVTEEQINKVKYLGLKKWMLQNNVSFSELTRLIYGQTNRNQYNTTHSRICAHKDIPKSFIDNLIKITGLPYEVLFEE